MSCRYRTAVFGYFVPKARLHPAGRRAPPQPPSLPPPAQLSLSNGAIVGQPPCPRPPYACSTKTTHSVGLALPETPLLSSSPGLETSSDPAMRSFTVSRQPIELPPRTTTGRSPTPPSGRHRLRQTEALRVLALALSCPKGSHDGKQNSTCMSCRRSNFVPETQVTRLRDSQYRP